LHLSAHRNAHFPPENRQGGNLRELPGKRPVSSSDILGGKAINSRESVSTLNPVSTSRRKAILTKVGLAFWMESVLEECGRADTDLEPDPVHDLRVALRRCRSMVDGLIAVDPDPEWKRVKKAGKRLFQSLGDLRDVHVMEEWGHHFDSPGDVVAGKLFEFLASREAGVKQQAAQALRDFDRKQWKKWSVALPRRAARLRPGSVLFKHLALERWTEAYQLHHRALRNQTHTVWHALRIGIKRFRYSVENFLPEQHERWAGDLKKLQDILGEVHDLDVLWATVQQLTTVADDSARQLWHDRIAEERLRRIESYRVKTVGKTTVWQAWRAELPQGKEVETAALLRLKRWASVLDPDFKHSMHVYRLALQLHDGLARLDGATKPPGEPAREILRLAALLHGVGSSKEGKPHPKATYRLITRLTAPLGIKPGVLQKAGLVARYQNGALPFAGQKALRGLMAAERNEVAWLAGILRFAVALDADGTGQISDLNVRQKNGFIEIAARGYSARDRAAEKIAAARHLLETVTRGPVMVKAQRPPRGRLAARSRSATSVAGAARVNSQV
jgi:CHAD domain-containing protein